MAGRGDIEAGKAFVVLGVKRDPLTQGLKAAGASVSRWVSGISSAINTIQRLTSGLVETAQHIDKIAKGADKLGVTTQSFVALEHAANLADVSIESLQKAFFKMQQAMVKTPKSFEELGLNIEDLRNMAPDKQFEAVADALSKIDDAADLAAANVKIFGKGAQDLIPLLLEGSAGIEKSRKETEAYGIAVGKLDANQIEEMNDAVTRLKASWSGFSVSMTAAVAGPLTDTLVFFTDLVAKLNQTESWLQRIRIVLEAFGAGANDVAPGSITSMVGPITDAQKRSINRLLPSAGGGAPEPAPTVEDKKLAKEIAKAGKEAERALEDLQDDANRLFEETRLPEEELQAQLLRLQSFLSQGLISDETFGRATDKAIEEMERARSIENPEAEAALERWKTDEESALGFGGTDPDKETETFLQQFEAAEQARKSAIRGGGVEGTFSDRTAGQLAGGRMEQLAKEQVDWLKKIDKAIQGLFPVYGA